MTGTARSTERRATRRAGAARVALLAVAALAALGGCASTAERKEAAAYGPTESVLEVVAVLRRHVPDDTYRFLPATDFSGRNVYRASLMRLENIETIHAESLRAGHFDGVIAFAKARALERLRAYDLAAGHYRRAAERDAELAGEAAHGARVCEALARAAVVGLDTRDPLAEDTGPLPADAAAVVDGLDERTALLEALLDDPALAPHHAAVVREEIERADATRAGYFEAMRFRLEDGHVRALSERQRLVTRHATSARRLQHELALANLYAALSREYVAATPPTSLAFDPPRLSELVNAAARIYQRVAAEDGRPEKLEAARRLESFLAFTLQVDGDRFTR